MSLVPAPLDIIHVRDELARILENQFATDRQGELLADMRETGAQLIALDLLLSAPPPSTLG
jgi:hypothetical protein